MAHVLIIGACGVGRVVTHKCVMNKDVFTKITLASRRLESCKVIQEELPAGAVGIEQVDADNTTELEELIVRIKADIVINVALPYQDLTIMDACLKTNIQYLDTANYEHHDEAKFEYKEQWEKHAAFKEKGLMEFTTEEPIRCEGLTQVFTKPTPFTGIIYEFIEREKHGFCQDSVKFLMESTRDLK